MGYEANIGLEVHAQLLTLSKIFCSCSTQFGALPNTNTCPVCLGMPGVLPVLNQKAVEYALKTAIALNCEIREKSIFARKNYFYPDLPKGYQISQYERPLAEDGYLEFEINRSRKRVRIKRVHLEEDAGKNIHVEGKNISLVDFNRCGVPLIEIVSEPDIASPEEAGAYLRMLRQILRWLEVCDGNMEEGSFRCDANVSVKTAGAEELGTKTELKNMNSFRWVEKALEYEIQRQKKEITGGGKIVQETRLWDVPKQITRSMRGKEEAHDYRYFPDPDLIPLVVAEEWINTLKKEAGELPLQKAKSFVKNYGIPQYDANVLCIEKELASYFEEVAAGCKNPKSASNWIMTEVMREIKDNPEGIRDFPVTTRDLSELIKLIDTDVITGKIAKQVFEEMVKTQKAPAEIVEEKDLRQLKDETALETLVEKVIKDNPKQVAKYQSGQKGVLGFFVGKIMRETQGKANPKIVNELLRKKLK